MRRLILILVSLHALNTIASAEKSDFGVWTFLGASKKINHVMTVYTEAEYRNRENAHTTDCWSLYGELSARICPFLRGGGGYTFIHYNNPGLSWEPRHRLNLFLAGNYSTGAWNFTLRERYEEVHRRNSGPKRSLRSRIECIFKTPHSIFAPYATAELYTTLKTGDKAMSNEKMRYTFGTLIQFAKKHTFSVYYRYIDMTYRVGGNSHILGAGFKFNL